MADEEDWYNNPPEQFDFQAEVGPNGEWSDRFTAMLRGIVDRNEAALPSPNIPPWLAAPNIPFRSMGWRMGCGEDIMHRHLDFLEGLSADDYAAYVAANPEPESWSGWYRGIERMRAKQ